MAATARRHYLPTPSPSAKVAILTGASRGIGRSIAVDLVKAGFGVLIVARSAEGLAETKAVCEAATATARVACCAIDVCAADAPNRIVKACIKAFGRITAVVHNVGVNMAAALHTGEASVPTMSRVLDVNLRSVMALTAATMPHLLRNALNGSETEHVTDDPSFAPSGNSTVVFVSSLLGRQAALVPGHAAYAATKAGLSGFASGLWAEVRQSGVHVCTIYPGLVATGMGAGFSSEFGRLLNAKLPQTEYLQPTDVSRTVLMALMQPRTSCITEVDLQPQRDLFRQALFANIPALRELAESEPIVPFKDRRVAFVTGAGKGIGRAIAMDLARDYDGVAVIARSKADLHSLRDEVAALNPHCLVLPFALDVRDTEAMKLALDETVRRCGTLSTVVSNAGTNRRRSAALCPSGKVWEDVTDINLLASMHLTRLALPHLIRHHHRTSRKGSALIAYVNSHYAHPAQQVLPGQCIYVTTKTGLAGFAKAVLEDVREMGVKVTTLFPGLVNTDLGRSKGPIAKKYKTAPITPEDMIQCGDLVYALRYVIGCSATACPSRIETENVAHTLPLVRREAKRFMKGSAPEWMYNKCKL